MGHVVVWSGMRSGSSEFAMDVSRRYGWRYVGEPFNTRLSEWRRWGGDAESILESLVQKAKGRRLVMKLFRGHSPPPLGPFCKVVLERRVEERWCSLKHARRTGEWSGKVRRNCSMTPPPAFVRSHREWYTNSPKGVQGFPGFYMKKPPDLYLTFEDVVTKRNESLWKVGQKCGAHK